MRTFATAFERESRWRWQTGKERQTCWRRCTRVSYLAGTQGSEKRISPERSSWKTFSKKNFEKIWRERKNALPLQTLSRWNGSSRKDSSLKDFRLTNEDVVQEVVLCIMYMWDETRTVNNLKRIKRIGFLKQRQQYSKEWKIFYNEEFDPGSGWTLATGLTHASRGAAWT